MPRTELVVLVSDETIARLRRFAAAHAIDEAGVVEQALLHHLGALEALPRDAQVPPRILLGSDGFCRVVDALADTRPPTPEMKALFAEDTGG